MFVYIILPNICLCQIIFKNIYFKTYPPLKFIITFSAYFVKIVSILNIRYANIFTYWIFEPTTRRKNGRDVL